MNKSWIDRKTVLLAAAVLFLLCTLGMGAVDGFIQNETTPYGIVSFEFISTIANSNAAMSAWGSSGKTAAGISLGLDYLYIVLYSVLGWLGLTITGERLAPMHKGGGKFLLALAYVFPLAGLMDATENYSLIRLLLGSQNSLWPQLAYHCALIKFAGAAVCVLSILIGQVYAFIQGRQN